MLVLANSMGSGPWTHETLTDGPIGAPVVIVVVVAVVDVYLLGIDIPTSHAMV